MEIVVALLYLSLPAGLLMALGAPFLRSVTPSARHFYGGAVAALLVLWAGLAAWIVVPRADGDGALPWLVALIAAPLAVAAIIGLAIRDERARGAAGWVPTTVFAGFPAFVFVGVVVLLSGAS